MYNNYFVTAPNNRELPSSRFVFQNIKNDADVQCISRLHEDKLFNVLPRIFFALKAISDQA